MNIISFCIRARHVIYYMRIQENGGRSMAYDQQLIAAKLRRWEKYLLKFRLPEWQ